MIEREVFLREPVSGWRPIGDVMELSERSETSRAISKHLSELSEAAILRQAKALAEREGISKPEALEKYLLTPEGQRAYAELDERKKNRLR